MTDHITLPRAVVEQALEALEVAPYMSNKDDYESHGKAITALRTELAEKATVKGSLPVQADHITLRRAAEKALSVIKWINENGPTCRDAGYTRQHADAEDAESALREALTKSEQDWSLLESTQASLREHMAEIQRLRAMLAEPVQEPQGCDHCRHPLYAGIKCRVCGRVTEPVQEITDTERLNWLDTLPCGITIHGDSSFPQSQSATPKTPGASHIRDLIDRNRAQRKNK